MKITYTNNPNIAKSIIPTISFPGCKRRKMGIIEEIRSRLIPFIFVLSNILIGDNKKNIGVIRAMLVIFEPKISPNVISTLSEYVAKNATLISGKLVETAIIIKPAANSLTLVILQNFTILSTVNIALLTSTMIKPMNITK